MMAAVLRTCQTRLPHCKLTKQPMQVPLPTSVFFVVVEMEDALHKVLVKHGRVACEEKVTKAELRCGKSERGMMGGDVTNHILQLCD